MHTHALTKLNLALGMKQLMVRLEFYFRSVCTSSRCGLEVRSRLYGLFCISTLLYMCSVCWTWHHSAFNNHYRIAESWITWSVWADVCNYIFAQSAAWHSSWPSMDDTLLVTAVLNSIHSLYYIVGRHAENEMGDSGYREL